MPVSLFAPSSALTYTANGSREAPLIFRKAPTAREVRSEGRLAQLVRAPALQAGGRRFESCTAHHFRHVSVDPGALGSVLDLKEGDWGRSPRMRLFAFLTAFLVCASLSGLAQGGPPYYTNDPGTPGHLNWEINVGYMPFLYSDQSVTHTPDIDINFGVGDRIQLTYENAWLRLKNPKSATEYSLGQSNPGVSGASTT